MFPHALVKVFLDATPLARAERRLKDLSETGAAVELTIVQTEMEERDRRDSTRADSPLVQAPDAVYVDTTPHSLGEVEEIILKIVRDRTSNGKELAR